MLFSDALEHINSITTPVRNYIDYLRELIKPFKYVVFYGAGSAMPGILEPWKLSGLCPVSYLCDNNPVKWGAMIQGIECISPDRLLEIKDDCIIFLTLGNYTDAYHYLVNNGCPKVLPVYAYDIRFHLDKTRDLALLREKLADTWQLLSDSKSQTVFNIIVSRFFRGTQDPYCMLGVYEPDQYFSPDVVKLSNNESFVDVGAYDGDTLKDFLPRVNNHFDNYYAFEMCADNFQQLQQNTKLIPDNKNIHLFSEGCWDSRQTLNYRNTITSSQLGQGNLEAQLDTLDSMLSDKPVSFIKMDIEGAEMHALRGAENIIKTQKPKKAICVYHNINHLWGVPLYHKSLVSEYKFYFRHHTRLEYETV